MKNATVIPSRPIIRVRVEGLPPLQGWAVRLLADVPEAGYKDGDWLSSWSDYPHIDFMFEPELHMVFGEEGRAKWARDILKNQADIATEVVKIGNPGIDQPARL